MGAGAFAGAKSYRPLKERSELDRWIISELNATCRTVVERMDQYDNYAACQAIIAFVDALSNWYVRRSRDRFWAADKRSPEKLDAYWTLYECLITTAKLIAPFVPFLAESLWRNLTGVFKQGAGSGEHGARTKEQKLPAPCSLLPAESVHLCNFPTGDASAIDQTLSVRMNLVREISSLGRQARTSVQLKVRQPLAKVEVILVDRAHQPWLESHAALIAEELNVKAVEFTANVEQYVEYTILPNFKRLGPRFGKYMTEVKKRLGEQLGSENLARAKSVEKLWLDVAGKQEPFDEEDLEVRLQAKPGWTAAQGRGVVVVLATELTPDLLFEGMANDLIRFVQDKRKEIECEFTDRISLHIVVESSEAEEDVVTAISLLEVHKDRIAEDTLAPEIHFISHNSEEGGKHLTLAGTRGYNPIGLTLRGHQIVVDIQRLSSSVGVAKPSESLPEKQ